jgi:hypothetical protein
MRKLLLTAHVTLSVGWLGSVVVFLVLALIGLMSRAEQTVRGVYLVMEPAAWGVLVPLALAALVSGIVQSLISQWGLFRHYWVVFKLLINLFAALVLLIYMGTFQHMRNLALDESVDLTLVRNPSPFVHALLAVLILLVATVLAVFKPRGVTPFGRRR